MASRATSRYRIALICTAFFLASWLLTSFSARNPWTSGIGVHVVSALLRPFQSVEHGTVEKVGGLWESYVALRGVREENELLKQRLSALEAENSRLVETESELGRLRGLVGLTEQASVKGVAANVIGWDPSSWSRTLVIDKGTAEGVKPGASVLQDKGVVGQVISASAHSARVLLIIDRTSGVDAIIQGSRLRGVVMGLGTLLCDLQYAVRDSEEEVKLGDRVITSGMDGVYSKGLLIGIVSEIKPSSGLFQSIRIKPSVDIERLETLLVVTSEPRDESGGK